MARPAPRALALLLFVSACTGSDDGFVTTRPETFRSQYHFTPETGWLNDPNGLVYYAGEFHLFFQHNPAFPLFGDMHWGHAVSTDLVHWQQLPVALSPDPQLGQAYSGSAVVATGAAAERVCGLTTGDCLVAIFSHHGGDSGDEKQSLAWSVDRGRTWTLYANNPVLANPGLADFRDPKVFWHAPSNRWLMVVAAGQDVRFYGSADLVDWTELSLFTPPGTGDGVLECPELFELAIDGGAGETRWLLKVDRNRNFANADPAAYYSIGSFDGTTFLADDTATHLVDFGADFYAAQRWNNAPAGRSVWLAWMNNWAYALGTPTETWRGAMTIPRQLDLVRDGQTLRLRQQPIAELDGLRKRLLLDTGNTEIQGVMPAQVRGATLEIHARFEPGASGETGLRVRVGDGESTAIGYDAGRGEVFVDRTASGTSDFSDELPVRRAAPIELDGGAVDLIVYVDWSSVEVFAQNGRAVISLRIFPAPASDRVELFADSPAQLVRLEAYELRSIWE